MSESEWLTAKEIAAICGVDQLTVHGWNRKQMGPPFYRFGGALRYKRTEFEEWYKSRKGLKR
jgi:predicted DNA-binding transcriptional regulator AlpA